MFKAFKDFRCWAFYQLLTKKRLGLIPLGQECQWTIFPDHLESGSRVLCAGAGHDISFELEISEKFNCNIELLDPSPTGIETCEKNLKGHASIRFRSVALADEDGMMELADPVDAEEGSFRSLVATGQHGVAVECRGLESLMKELGWYHIDLLKMDIEGGEFAVLKSIRDRGIKVDQICVEFHHGENFTSTGSDTIKAILALTQVGYVLVHRVHWDHTFVHKSLL